MSCPWVSCLLGLLFGQAGTQALGRLGGPGELPLIINSTLKEAFLGNVTSKWDWNSVWGDTQRHPRRWHHPSTVGEHLLGWLGFTNSAGSIPQVLGKGFSYEIFTGLGKRGKRDINCRSDGLQLPTALMSCPSLSHPHTHRDLWCLRLGLPGCPATWLGVNGGA